MKDSEIAWFRPLWKRVAVTVFVAVWCALEWLVFRDQLFALLTSAALAYALWNLFFTFPKDGGPGAPGPGAPPPA